MLMLYNSIYHWYEDPVLFFFMVVVVVVIVIVAVVVSFIPIKNHLINTLFAFVKKACAHKGINKKKIVKKKVRIEIK